MPIYNNYNKCVLFDAFTILSYFNAFVLISWHIKSETDVDWFNTARLKTVIIWSFDILLTFFNGMSLLISSISLNIYNLLSR
jgi:hypothetical protein